MLVVDSVNQLRDHINSWRRNGDIIAFVPTMGNLHEGHLKLVDVARQQADQVVASIFVNPLQFPPGSDYESYPRTREEDEQKLRERQVALLFCPDDTTIYPDGMESSTRVCVPGLSDILCGEFRPGHFDGVTTVVAKLFSMVQPDIAVFGEKDYQQLLIIKRMVADLFMPVTVIGVETCRESDGLAMSSRNNYLSAEQRKIAGTLYQTLADIAQQVNHQRQQLTHETVNGLQQDAVQRLCDAGFKPDYVRIVDARDLSSATADTASIRILAAAWLGSARLIDNIAVDATN